MAVLSSSPVSAADDPLARARLLYNQQNFDGAVIAAEQARLTPSRADAADLIAARAYLERYRGTSATDDLTNARERLRRLDPLRFDPRERVEYIVGLGETLYFDGSYGAAATVFESVLQANETLTATGRNRVLDWWAAAVDRETRARPDAERHAAYQRVRQRMADELSMHPGSATASYWASAAARAEGDVQTAWDAAQAGWVRAALAGEGGAALRADLDRLVQKGIIPDRAKGNPQQADALRSQWEQFKEKWKK